jgi:hypothetical protein
VLAVFLIKSAWSDIMQAFSFPEAFMKSSGFSFWQLFIS